jgi:hypothetical protein
MVYLFRKAVSKISPTLFSKPNKGGRGHPSSGARALNKRKARKFERLGDEQSMSKFSPTAGSGTWDKEIMVWETGTSLREAHIESMCNVGVLTWIGYEYYVDSIFPVLVFFSDPLDTSKKPCTLWLGSVLNTAILNKSLKGRIQETWKNNGKWSTYYQSPLPKPPWKQQY